MARLIIGTAGDDTFTESALPNLIIAGSEHGDSFAFTTGFVYGGAGNDVITMGDAFHGVDGGPGDDALRPDPP